jgi:hypothetical protein
LIRTVSIPRFFALDAIFFTFPPCALLTYQIHIASPASGFDAAGAAGGVPCARPAPGNASASRIAATATAQQAAATARVR